MSEDQGINRFVKVTRHSLLKFLNSVKERLVIAKPGYFVDEINALRSLVETRGIECTLYVDPSEDAVRWGFGEEEALSFINDNASILKVQTAASIRLSVVVVDDLALIYAPVALSWEEEPDNVRYPNGFLGGIETAESFLLQMGRENHLEQNQIGGKVIPFPGCSIPDKTGVEVESEISTTLEGLAKNPPVDPSRLRKISVYRNNYKILKVELRGINIKNSSISLRAINSLLPNISERFRASWKLFSKGATDKLWQLGLFKDQVSDLIEKYTLNVKRFGYLIKTEDLTEFREKVENEKADLLKALKATEEDLKRIQSKYTSKKPEQQSMPGMGPDPEKRISVSLKTMVEESKRSLSEYYIGVVKNDPEAIDLFLSQNRGISELVQEGAIESEKALQTILSELIENKLRFPNPDEMLETVDAKVDPFDVSDELLYDNEEFKKCLSALKKSNNLDDQIKIRRFSDAFETDVK